MFLCEKLATILGVRVSNRKYESMQNQFTAVFPNRSTIGKANVNCKRVSGHMKADKTCGRAVIIIHYAIILPQHFLYNLNISCTCQRPDA